MYDFGKNFHIDMEKLKSKPEAIIQGKKYRFTVLTERLLRLEYSPSGVFNDFGTELVSFRNFDVPKFTKKEDNNYIEIETEYFSLVYTKEEPFKGTVLSPTANLKVVLKGKNIIWHYGHPEAKNYFGSNISAEVKGNENDFNKGLYSQDGLVSIDDSSNFRINEFGGFVPAEKLGVDIYLFLYNKDFGLCATDYFKLTGMPSLIPRYALGNWWSRDKAYTSDEVLDLVNRFEKYNIPLSVFLFDKDWHIRTTGPYKDLETGYTFNKNLIPEPKTLIDFLHNKGVRVGLSINPKDGVYPHEERYQDIRNFLEYKEEGLIAIDPLNPKMLDVLLKFVLSPLEDMGVDFFWNDLKEFKDLHKLWVLNHYMFNNLSRNPAKRGMILSRNALKAAHRYPVLYSGESKVSWENFMSIPFFNLSASNIGSCWWSHDVGGYIDGIEDPELYIRSVQLGTFSPIMRFHSAKGRYYKREPWRWDNKTFNIVGNYLRLRHRLTSYLYTEAYKYYKTGSMIFQPLYYYLPEVYDDLLYRNEYFFGNELLVAPIVNKKDPIMNRTIHRFFLPEGMWYEFTTGKKYAGKKKYISFYKEEDYPIFAKRGSIIPLSNKSNVNNTSNPTDIEIHVFPGQNNTYRMYEDDGISSLYKEGFYLITEIDYNYLPNNYTLIIRSIEGKSGIVPDKRNYKIRFRNTKFAEDVIVYFNSTQIEVTNKYVENNDFIVEVNGVSTVGQLTINCKGKDIEIDAVRVINEDIDLIISDLQIQTVLKEKISEILFSDDEIKIKRIKIRKLKKDNLDKSFINLFLKLLEYIQDL